MTISREKLAYAALVLFFVIWLWVFIRDWLNPRKP
jgi:hypothetical protein